MSVGRVLAARSTHGDFADYHERFGHEVELMCNKCARRKSPLHVWICIKSNFRRPAPIVPFRISVFLCTYARPAKA